MGFSFNRKKTRMGSSGTGRFTDYSGTSSQNSKIGGSSGEDKCGKAFTTSLEEVERSAYFKDSSNLPPKGTKINIVFNKPRLAAVADDTVIGYLPTDKNYIKACLESGYEYPGVVSSSLSNPVPSIQITVSPHK
jgi:hypothetical protein